ncbi:MAG TPA: methyltransferase [Gemmatimonadaceae bacterium]
MFDSRVAERDLRRYRRRGPHGSSRALIAALRSAGVQRASLLDIGAGVGAVTHELLDAGATHAMIADASAAYAAAARAEAARRGHAKQLDVHVGDFVTMAEKLPVADVVTLDRVICCYPDMPSLVARSTAHARRLYGVVYPRNSWWVRLVGAAGNVMRRLSGNPFRSYVHPEQGIDAAVRQAGFRRRYLTRRLVWIAAVYERSPSP